MWDTRAVFSDKANFQPDFGRRLVWSGGGKELPYYLIATPFESQYIAYLNLECIELKLILITLNVNRHSQDVIIILHKIHTFKKEIHLPKKFII